MRYLLLFLMLLSGCKEKELTPVGKDYYLIQPESQMTITLKLDVDGRFYGKAINNYFGIYQINEKEISLNLQGQTMMAGPLPHMEFENDYFKSLRSIKTFELNNNTLILNGNQKYIFEQSNTN